MDPYCGVSSFDILFDILEARMPSKSELRKSSLGNDCALRDYLCGKVTFMSSAFWGSILRPGSQQLPHCRLFVDVQSYFGMVETQARGALHIQFFIWLTRRPLNWAAMEAILNSANAEQFCQSLQSYVESIVRNELPIDLNQHSCSVCRASVDHPSTRKIQIGPHGRSLYGSF